MSAEEKENPGFKVKDRRRFNPDGTLKEESSPAAEASPPPVEEERGEESRGASVASSAADAADGEGASRGKRWKERLFGARKKEKGSAPAGKGKEAPLPEIDFLTFLLSLQSAALFHLGLLSDPASEKREVNLPQAKQTIDILGILEEKTKGNLTKEEEQALTRILTDLRLMYVKVQG